MNAKYVKEMVENKVTTTKIVLAFGLKKTYSENDITKKRNSIENGKRQIKKKIEFMYCKFACKKQLSWVQASKQRDPLRRLVIKRSRLLERLNSNRYILYNKIKKAMTYFLYPFFKIKIKSQSH